MTEQIVDVLAQTERRLANLARENARLKMEANRLRARVEPGKWNRILENAREDAKLILHLRHAQTPCSRRWLDAAGLISARRYGWALGLLRFASIDDDDVTALESLDTALQGLDRAADWLAEHGTEKLLELRMNAGKFYMLGRYN